MSYPENKSERYALIGGLNNKASRYLTGQQEVIRLVNYDFSVPGALTKRPDTAQFLGTSFGTDIQGIFEQTYFSGVSYRFVFGLTGAYFAGASTGVGYFGVSTAAFSGITATPIGGIPLNRLSSINTVDNYWVASAPVKTNAVGQSYINARFLRWHASFGYFANAQMEIASPLSSLFGASTFVSATTNLFFTTGFGYRYSLALVNERGVVGPATPLLIRPWAVGTGASHGIAIAVPSTNTVPTRFYDNAAAGTMLLFRDTVGITAVQLSQPDVAITTGIFAIPVSAGNTQIIDRGYGFSSGTVNGDTWLLNPLQIQGLAQNDYYRLAFDARFAPPYKMLPLNPLIGITTGVKNTGEPRYLAVLNNMMMYAGFSMAPSHVFWSQLGTPEWVANEDFNEVRTDNGDIVTGMIPYLNSVLVGKKQSIHEVTGTSPDNISFQQTTAQYGFMNNQSLCVWNDQMWFIDGSGKGIGSYNGANTEIISTKVEDIFKRINLTAATFTAWMLHVKQRNEVWAAIPVDGSTTPNVLIVFDYVSQCWTTFEGLSANVAAICKGSLTLPVPVMGFSNGDIRYMNATYTGAEFMTTVVRFPFVTNFGWSTTQVFRRLYVDVDPVVGMTHLFSSNYYLNDSNTVSLTRGVTTISHQTRLDFGLPGNGMSVELIEGSTLATRVMGYTVESRFQRSV